MMDRRTLLATAPLAIGAGLAMKHFTDTTDTTETAVAGLFREWEQYWQSLLQLDNISDEQGMKLRDLAKAVAAEPATCAADALLKIIALTDHGEAGIEDTAHAPGFWKEVETFAGIDA